MHLKSQYIFTIIFLANIVLLAGCSSDSESDAATDPSTPTDTSSSVLDLSLLRNVTSTSTVSCTLGNGSVTSCYELVFNVNEVRDGSGNGELVDDEFGPFCPSSYTATDGGVGVYDGATDAGFQNLNQTLWDNMAADGYDLIDESAGVICIQDPGGSAGSTGSNCNAYCLNATADDGLTVTFTIPITPEMLGTPAQLREVEHIGMSLDGVPITGNPPSVIGRGGNIPSIDHCGGHHDPAGYFHWHLVPESADLVHEAQGTDDQARCANIITQDNTALTGFARDGFPIYAYQDLISGEIVRPTDLDSCNGHSGTTEEYPDGVYHYHASLDAPSLPTCISGAAVDQRTSPRVR